MHFNKTIEKDKFNLIDNIGGDYFINFNVKETFEEEKKFKNNAFVKTGRLIPTGFINCWSVVNYKTKPTLNAIKKLVFDDIDKTVSNNILRGMVWNGYEVWLSQENQKNYSDWYLLANNESELPVLTAKFTKLGKPVYYDFSTKEEIKSLYIAMIKHINECVNFGRKLKDNFDLFEYKKCLDKM
jgi:hypothetical protein